MFMTGLYQIAAFETLWVLAIGISVIYVFAVIMRGLRGYFVDEAGKKANLKISAAFFKRCWGCAWKPDLSQ